MEDWRRSAWNELEDYVKEVIADGGIINPVELLDYMTELKHRYLRTDELARFIFSNDPMS